MAKVLVSGEGDQPFFDREEELRFQRLIDSCAPYLSASAITEVILPPTRLVHYVPLSEAVDINYSVN